MPLSPEYRAYLASEQWQRVRRAALSHALGRLFWQMERDAHLGGSGVA